MTRRRWLAVAAAIALAVLLLVTPGHSRRPPAAHAPRPAVQATAAVAVAVRLLAAVTDLDTAHPVPDWRMVEASTIRSFAAALHRDPPRLAFGQRQAGGRQRLTVARTAVRLERSGAVVQVVGILTITGRESTRVAVAWTCQLVATSAGWRVAGLS